MKRDETRGAHYKPEFPERDDENFLKTTIAQYDEKNNEPVITYEDVDISHIKPRKRDYTKKRREQVMMAEQSTVTFIITRQDSPESSPYQETFEIPYKKKI